MLVIGFYESVTIAVIAAIGRPASFFGVLMSIQAVGSIIGGLAVGPLIKRVGEARTLGTALFAWAVASLTYTIPVLPAACAALAIFGVAVPLNAVVVSTATQRYSPPQLQGRTFAASFMAADLAQTLAIAIGASWIRSATSRYSSSRRSSYRSRPSLYWPARLGRRLSRHMQVIGWCPVRPRAVGCEVSVQSPITPAQDTRQLPASAG
jgi:MFS family permease